MDKVTLNRIRNNSYLYSYLRDNSHEYKYLLRDDKYLKIIEDKAKEKYKLRTKDKLEKLNDQINLIKTFINMID